MANWIRPARVRAAITALADWRLRAKSQPAMHLWPLLALIEGGARKGAVVEFSEENDRDFWNRYARLPGDDRPDRDQDGFTADFYVEPLTLTKKPSDYYHRSPATIRVRTFANSWGAATFDSVENSDRKRWVLADDYAEIFERKALTRASIILRVPVVDLAAWLFFREDFPDDATAQALEDRFLERFPFDVADYERLFEFVNEDPRHIFSGKRPSNTEYREAIEQALTREKPAPAPGSAEMLSEDDPVFMQVRRLLSIGSSGIILRGCPGTSKTWYASQIALALTEGNEARILRVQFHPSYGYEDFVEGYAPYEKSKAGFRVVDKVFLDACERAASSGAQRVVLIIDEINRGDPGRVFGELLTYIEEDYRGTAFPLPYSKKVVSVPTNLILLGTMNQYDKSITPLDLALLRRFDHIDLKPSAEMVEEFLGRSGEFGQAAIERVVEWFESMQTILPFGIGHTYFKSVRTPEDLHTIWQYRMLPYCESVLEIEVQSLEHAKRSFDAMYKAITGQAE